MEISLKYSRKVKNNVLADIMIAIMLISYQLYSFVPSIDNILKIIIPAITLLVILKRNNFRLNKNIVIVWLFLFLFVSIFSIYITLSVKETIGRIVAILSLMLFIITLSQYIVNINHINNVINYLIYGSILYTIIFFFVNIIVYRSITSNEYPMTVNNIVTPSFYYILWKMIIRKEYNKKNFIILLLFSLISLLSGIKKAIVFPFIFLVVMLSEKNKGKYLSKIVYTVLLLSMVYLLYCFLMNNSFMYEIIGQRFEGLFNYFTGAGRIDGSTRTRFALMEDAWDVFKNNILLGVGLGAFKEATDFNVYAHNNFLELLASIGIIGFLSFYWIHIYILLKLKFNKLTNNDHGILFFSVILSNIIHDIGTISYYRFSFIIPICLAASYININKKRSSIK